MVCRIVNAGTTASAQKMVEERPSPLGSPLRGRLRVAGNKEKTHHQADPVPSAKHFGYRPRLFAAWRHEATFDSALASVLDRRARGVDSPLPLERLDPASLRSASSDSILDYRDRAILKFYLYTGARFATGCRLKVADFHQDEDEATIRLHERGEKRQTIGLHYWPPGCFHDFACLPASTTPVPPHRDQTGSSGPTTATFRVVTISCPYFGQVFAGVRKRPRHRSAVRYECCFSFRWVAGAP
jgi:hypothetical protein